MYYIHEAGVTLSLSKNGTQISGLVALQATNKSWGRGGGGGSQRLLWQAGQATGCSHHVSQL